MKRLFSLPASSADFPASVITLGVFDGVHRGHVAILQETVARARAHQFTSIVITFDTHPLRHLSGTSPQMITSLEHRLTLFDRLGLDVAVVLPFGEALAQYRPERFVEEILMERLGARVVVLGHDSRFGRNGAGDAKTMARLGETFGFETVCLPAVLHDGAPVSSTAIRAAVERGALEAAREMLGRNVSVFGTVQHGGAMGREWGIPTLNIDPHHELHPPRGVYITSTRAGDSLWPSVTNIGHRPTIDAQTSEDLLIETHVLADIGMLYEQNVEVMFHQKIRDEMTFSSREALVERIMCDVAACREWHAAHAGDDGVCE